MNNNVSTRFIQLESRITEFISEKEIIKQISKLKVDSVLDFLNFVNGRSYEKQHITRYMRNDISNYLRVLDGIFQSEFNFDYLLENEDLTSKQEFRNLNEILDIDVGGLVILDNLKNSRITIRALIEWQREFRLSVHDRYNINFFFAYLSKNLLLGSEHLLSIFHDVSSQFSSLDEIERYFTKFIDENFLEKEKYVLIERFSGDKKRTLESISKDLCITRERVRQLQLKFEKKMHGQIYLDERKIINSLGKIHSFERQGIIMIIFDYLVSKGHYIKLKDFKNTYIKASEKLNFDELLSKVNSHMQRHAYLDLGINYEGFDSDNLKRVLSQRYELKSTSLYVRHSMNDAIKLYMSSLDGSLNFNNKMDVTNFMDALSNEFLFDKRDLNLRYIENILIKNFFLVGPRNYIEVSKVAVIPWDIMCNIFRTIETKTITNGKEIFLLYKGDLEQFSIDNPTMIYFYIKYFYPEEFNFGGVSLAISTKNVEANWADNIINLIKEYNAPLDYSQLNERFSGFSKITFNNLIVNNDKIFDFGNGLIYLKELITLTDFEKKDIWLYLYNHSFTSVSRLFYGLNQLHKDLFTRNHITNETQLIKFIELIFPNDFDYNKSSQSLYYRK